MRRLVLGALLVCAGAAPALADTHVRVVLDTSESMRRYDPARLATLSTLLLYDLALVNSTLGDSFEVIPFHPSVRWSHPSDPAPTATGPRLRADFRSRATLARSLTRLPYDADWTYCYPGLREAVIDLEATSGGATDVRVVVLVTDGLPEEPTRDAEEALIRNELAPRLKAASIRLYVLAFGPQAYPNRAFFDRMVGGLGQVFVDQDGSRLLESMIAIFSSGFGYDPSAPQRLPVGALDLAAGKTHERVAVVLFRPRPEPPVLRLRTPRGGAVNSEGVREGRERRASYQMAWVLSPAPGLHPIAATAAAGATVAVLRPIRVTLEIRSPRSGGRVDQVMAGREVPLEVLVRPAGGGRGDPGAVNLTYQTLGPRVGRQFAWEGDVQAPPAGRERKAAAMRIYPIYPKFPQPDEGDPFYVGHLEVASQRGGTIDAHRVEVYPLVAIAPVPALADAVPEGSSTVRGLGRWERGCARFRLELAQGRLPDPEYSLRAVLPASTPRTGGLAGASWTLDGLPLEVELPGPSRVPSPWTRGRSLPKADLFGEHEVCVQAGTPTAGDPGKPYRLPVTFTLLKSPYDAFAVIEPFRLKVLIDKPSPIELWGSRLALLASLLALLAAVWLLRSRPDLPGDLLAAVGRADSRASLAPAPLRERALGARLLGLVGERPVVCDAGGVRLGALKPVRDELYRFRPARGVRVETAEGKAPEMLGDWAALAVHRTYRLRQGEQVFLLRVEYR